MVGLLVDILNDDLNKVLEVEFKKGYSEKVVDYLVVVINVVLDGDDVGLRGKGVKNNEIIVFDIFEWMDFEVDMEIFVGVVVGWSNDVMDVDDICDIFF